MHAIVYDFSVKKTKNKPHTIIQWPFQEPQLEGLMTKAPENPIKNIVESLNFPIQETIIHRVCCNKISMDWFKWTFTGKPIFNGNIYGFM